MRDHELELIAALVEGRLDDETEARALIASSEEARTEYEAQKTAFDALSRTGSASMTETERSALRRDIWTEFRTASAPTTPTTKPWYYRWTPVAAGLFVLIGLAAVLSQGGGADGFAAADESAAETTVAASEETDAIADSLEEGHDDAGGETLDERATSPTAGGASDGDASQAIPPAAAAFYSAEAGRIRGGEETDFQARVLEAPSREELEDCLTLAGLEDYEVHEVNPTPDETERDVEVPEEAVPYIAAIPAGSDLATAEVAFVDLETCEILHVDR